MINETDSRLNEIANRFQIKGKIKSILPLGEGFINDSFIVETSSSDHPNYFLQRKNQNVFKNIPGMMDNISKVTSHLKKKIIASGGNPDRESVTLIETNTNELYALDDQSDYWTMCLFIKDHKVFEKVSSPKLARAGGEGIGQFQNLLSDFNEPLVDTLPGFHNIRFRFDQWDMALNNDRSGRVKFVEEEINFIESRRAIMLKFWELIEKEIIPARVTHNDTKISNILFDNNDEVLCVIDLDTVLKSTVLNDFGDAIRSYANTGKEDEKDITKIDLDMQYFQSFTQGYLSKALSFLSEIELEYLAFSSNYITYEQTLRFLMDYIEGDKYYKISYPEHNLTRARAQKKLLECMEAKINEMSKVVLNLSRANESY